MDVVLLSSRYLRTAFPEISYVSRASKFKGGCPLPWISWSIIRKATLSRGFWNQCATVWKCAVQGDRQRYRKAREKKRLLRKSLHRWSLRLTSWANSHGWFFNEMQARFTSGLASVCSCYAYSYLGLSNAAQIISKKHNPKSHNQKEHNQPTLCFHRYIISIKEPTVITKRLQPIWVASSEWHRPPCEETSA